MTQVVRPAAAEDAEPIRELMRRVIEETIDLEHRAGTIENVNSNVGVWLQRSSDCVHLVAVSEDRIVGVVLIKDFWNLCSLFVAKSHQRAGLGRALVEKAVALCTHRSPKAAILLNAAPSAIPFYERLGFTTRESQQVLPPGFKHMHLPL